MMINADVSVRAELARVLLVRGAAHDRAGQLADAHLEAVLPLVLAAYQQAEAAYVPPANRAGMPDPTKAPRCWIIALQAVDAYAATLSF